MAKKTCYRHEEKKKLGSGCATQYSLSLTLAMSRREKRENAQIWKQE